MATSVISNTITDPSGTALEGVTINARLKPGGGFRISDSSEIASLETTTTNASGQWSLTLERTANITPSSSWWEIEEKIPEASGGPRVWTISVGSSNANLLASLVTAAANPALSTYLTQTAADARYAQIGDGASGLFINVKDAPYSALGDGSTDDTSAINAAISAANTAGGGTVVVPEGTFIVTTIVPKSNVTLWGSAGWASIIKLKNSTNPTSVIGNESTDAAVSYFAVRNLQIDGNKANNTQGRGVYVHGGLGNEVTGCYIHDTPYSCAQLGAVTASQASGAGRGRIAYNLCVDPALSGNFWGALAITGGDDSHVHDNIVISTDGYMSYGVDVEPNTSWTTRRITITANHITGGQIVATGTAGTVEDVVIADNYVKAGVVAGTGAGLLVDTVTGIVRVTDNYVKGPNHTKPAIHIKDTIQPVVLGNTATGMGTAQNTYPNNVGILLEDVNAGVVAGNFIFAASNTHATETAGILESGTTTAIKYGINHFDATIITRGADDVVVAGTVQADSYTAGGNTVINASRQGFFTAWRDPSSSNTLLTASSTALTFTDARNLVAGTATGTKIGVATGEKWAFWGSTPVVQQVLATGAGATVDNVISLLQTLGLCKQS